MIHCEIVRIIFTNVQYTAAQHVLVMFFRTGVISRIMTVKCCMFSRIFTNLDRIDLQSNQDGSSVARGIF